MTWKIEFTVQAARQFKAELSGLSAQTKLMAFGYNKLDKPVQQRISTFLTYLSLG